MNEGAPFLSALSLAIRNGWPHRRLLCMSIVKKRSVGQRLRQERERHNYSQEQLAELIDATALSINRWEHDKTLPRPVFRAALCRVFDMRAEVLFGLDEDEGEEEATILPVIWN